VARWDDELGDLVARRGRALNGYAYLLCGDAQQAEDLVQDALVKVFSQLRRPWRGRPAPVRTVDLDADPPGRPEIVSTEGYVRSAILTLYLDGYRRRRRWTGVRHSSRRKTPRVVPRPRPPRVLTSPRLSPG